MSYRIEKTESGSDLVIEGFEQGIAPSPHKGIANMQNLNIATEVTEASVNYSRTLQTQQPISSGTFTRIDSTHVSYTGNPALIAGTWVTVSASSIANLSAGVYFILSNSTDVYQLSTTLSTSNIVTGLGAGTATFNTTATSFSKFVAGTTNYSTSTDTYFIMDVNGVVMFGNPNFNYWTQLTPTGPSSGQATGLCAYNNYLFRMYTSSTTFLPTIDYCSLNTIIGGSAVSFTVMGTVNSSTTHFMLSGHDNTMYYTDGQYVGSVQPFFSQITGAWNYTAGSSTMTLFVLSGTSLVDGMPVQLTSSGTFPSGGQLSPNITYYVVNPIITNDGPNYPITLSGSLSSGATSGTLTSAWTLNTITQLVVFSTGEEKMVTFTNGSTSITWTGGLASNETAVINTNYPSFSFQLSAQPPVNGVDGSVITPTGTISSSSVLSLANVYFNPAVYGSVKWSLYALQLPAYETAQCLAELGTNLMVGGVTANLYPWDRASTTATNTTTSSFFYPVILPEPNTVQLVTVNNMLYVFCGSKGNVYITNGSSVSPVLTVPDYVTGSNEPVFTWGGTMYMRGRIWFSVQAPNCGGVWSFIPTQNFFIGQDMGQSLRLENQNSNSTYSGMATVLIPNQVQTVSGPQYWAAIWDGSTAYGIDYSATTPYTGGQALLESDAIPTGTLLRKRSFEQVEYKLSTALVTGESVQLYYRQDLGFNSNGNWISLGTVKTESNDPLSGYFTANFQNTQWLQIRAILTSTASSPSYCRLKQIRIR